MDLVKYNSLMKAFITHQLNYCLLILMFHSRQLNNRINRIHEIALRLVYKDYKLTFNDILELDNSVTTHQQKPQILETEILKVKNRNKRTSLQFAFWSLSFSKRKGQIYSLCYSICATIRTTNMEYSIPKH